jgi:peptide/nickel transport system permease protein
VAPYDPGAQHRDMPYAPPMRVRFVDHAGAWHARPFVYALKPHDGAYDEYDEVTDDPRPIRFFVRGSTYTILGIAQSDRHLVGIDAPGRLFLAGTDGFGRDLFSRILYGAQVSLVAGTVAAAVSLLLGLTIGALAGIAGRRIDELVMRTAELFIAVPWLYLLLAVRAFLPLHLDPRAAFLLVVGVIGAIGWARPARLVRGVVLSARERRYVVAGRGFGASRVYLLRRHVLPQTYGVLLTQAALLMPHYIVAEVTLSFLGLGLGEPVPSWGTLLAGLQQYHVVTSYWWMSLPALVILPVTLTYHLLAVNLHERLRPVAT